MSKAALKLFGFAILTLFIPTVHADQFHYNNVISGDRSMGLGGAYTAMSSDASGMVYNPAGMAFSLTNDFQGSANALFNKKITYKNTIGSEDFVEESDGQLAPFFGGLQKLDHISPGLVFAFGYYTTDSDLKDQDDKIINANEGILNFRQTNNQRASTTYFGVAVAKRLSSKLSIGFGTNYIKVDELTQTYQHAIILHGRSADGNTLYFRDLSENLRSRLIVNALQPVFGVQYVPTPKLSLGLTVKVATIISESYEFYKQSTIAYLNTDGSYVSPEVDAAEPEVDMNAGKIDRRGGADGKVENAMKQWPTVIKTGIAYFASPRFLVSADVSHHTKTEGKLPVLKRNAVTNFALGTEYYITPIIPIRMGLFSNFDTRSKPKAGKSGQADSVDYYGLSLFAGWVQSNSQIAAGVVTQVGEGKAQKIGGNTSVQDVEAMSNVLALSITSTF